MYVSIKNINLVDERTYFINFLIFYLTYNLTLTSDDSNEIVLAIKNNIGNPNVMGNIFTTSWRNSF